MVSREGACAAYYLYRRLGAGRSRRLSIARLRPSRPASSTSRAGPARCRCATRPTIVMGHGGGGAMSGELVEHLFLPAFGDAPLAPSWATPPCVAARRRAAGVLDRLVRRAAAVLPRRQHRRPGGQRHRQRPGDERRAAAVPVRRRSSSRRAPTLADVGRGRAARSARRRGAAGVRLVTGDTKVVDAGHGDGVYINTAGIGLVPDGVDIRPDAGPARRRGHRQRRHRRARHRGDERPRGPGVRHRRSRATAAPLNGLVAAMLAVDAGPPRAARPHPRRAGGLAQRDRQGRPASASSSSSGRCRSRDAVARRLRPSGPRPAATSPTRASSSRSCPRERRRRGAGRDARPPARAPAPR